MSYEAGLWCWVIHQKKKKRKKILISELQKYLNEGWEKGGPASKFKLRVMK